jgi:transposase-like protein
MSTRKGDNLLDHVPREDLLLELALGTYSTVAKKFYVDDKTVYKWVKKERERLGWKKPQSLSRTTKKEWALK